MIEIERTGLLIVLSSPSGAGKSTLSRRLIERDSMLEMSVSATTRAPRKGEIDGKDYQFVTKDSFQTMIDTGELLEHAEVFGNFYGTPRAPVAAAVAEGRDILFDVDWQGAAQIAASDLGRNLVQIFILPPSIASLETRLKGRAQDREEVIAGRMKKAFDEISHWPSYDYVLINDDLAVCYSQLETILTAERLRLTRQPGIGRFVETLNREFRER